MRLVAIIMLLMSSLSLADTKVPADCKNVIATCNVLVQDLTDENNSLKQATKALADQAVKLEN